MITAYEARQIYDNGEAVLKDFMEKIDKAIREVAAKQKSLPLYITPVGNVALWESHPRYDALQPTTMQEMVIKELVKLGFGAKLERHGDMYVPRGLADDNGEGPEYINHVIVVHW